MHHTIWRPISTVALAFTLLACSDPGQTLETVAPTTSTATPPSSAATTTTGAPSTTVEATTTLTPTTAVSTANTLALTEGPWTVVSSIPEVTEPGLYYELSLPGLYAYLTNNPSTVNNAFEIGRVETFSGAHSYRISGVGLNDYDDLLYWCKPFSVKVGDGEME